MKFTMLQKSETGFSGTIWIGDPCYIIKDWSKFLDVLWKDGDSEGIINTPHGEVFVFQTAYGDGEYPVYRDNKVIGRCGVDAGLLSVMYLETAEKIRRNKKEVRRLGVIVQDVAGTASSMGCGDAVVGDIRIITSDEGEE